jgi:hypothetical protein
MQRGVRLQLDDDELLGNAERMQSSDDGRYLPGKNRLQLECRSRKLHGDDYALQHDRDAIGLLDAARLQLELTWTRARW